MCESYEYNVVRAIKCIKMIKENFTVISIDFYVHRNNMHIYRRLSF